MSQKELIRRMNKRNHRILDHTIISYFLLIFYVSLFEETIGTGLDLLISKFIPGYAVEAIVMGKAGEICSGVGAAVSVLIAAWLFKLWFKPDFNGCLQKAGLKEGLLMLLPFLVIHYIGSIVSWITIGTGGVLIPLLRATAPGFGEEMMFRGLGVANYMRKIKSKDKIKVIFWLSSIVFGLIHLTNLMAGGDPKSVIIQSVYAIGVGMLLGAVYLRTGNLWPTILAHWSVDFFEMIRADLYDSGGLMTGMGIGDWITIVAGVFGAFWALRLMNPKYYDEIMEIWDRKWNKAASTEPNMESSVEPSVELSAELNTGSSADSAESIE